MLAEIYNWFTEGFDTADLQDAKALLDELKPEKKWELKRYPEVEAAVCSGVREGGRRK